MRSLRIVFVIAIFDVVMHEVIIKSFEEWNSVSPVIEKLIFDEGACNTINGDVYISNFPDLRSITVKKNSFKNLNLLTIRNNTQLETIVIEDGVSAEGGFHKVKTVVLQGDCLQWF